MTILAFQHPAAGFPRTSLPQIHPSHPVGLHTKTTENTHTSNDYLCSCPWLRTFVSASIHYLVDMLLTFRSNITHGTIDLPVLNYGSNRWAVGCSDVHRINNVMEGLLCCKETTIHVRRGLYYTPQVVAHRWTV